MKSFGNQLKNILKNFEKSVKKDIQKETMKIRAQNQKILLDDECELLLSEILQDDINFPAVLGNKFFNSDGTEISYNEEQKLRAKIHELINNGLITLQWGDGIPIIGRIEQKGRTYFEMKEKYKQLYYGENDMQFKILDSESESVLLQLLSNEEYVNSPAFIIQDEYPSRVIENLINLGYLDSKQGVSYELDGGYVCCAKLTQSAKSYKEMKEKYSNINNRPVNNYYAPVNNFSNANINNSVLQVGNVNSKQEIKITSEMINEAIEEINKNIETYGLSDSNKQKLKDLLEDLDKKNKKKPNLAMRALKGIWEFSKDVGCGLLTAYLTMKFGFNG